MNTPDVPRKQYPRAGQRITPLALYEVFDVLIDEPNLKNRFHPGTRLCDLNKSVWDYLNENECSRLAEQAIEHLSEQIFELPKCVRHRLIPHPPAGMRLQDLRLDRKTLNQLHFRGYASTPQALGNLTLLGLIRQLNFRARNVLDLLTALESYIAVTTPLPLIPPVDSSCHLNQFSPKDVPSRNREEYLWPRVRIAPFWLRELLDHPLPSGLLPMSVSESLRLYDLDESAWHRFTPEECRLLRRSVITTVADALPTLPRYLLDRKIPRPPIDLSGYDLKIGNRTRNCLARGGLLTDPSDMGTATIGQLMKIRGFGAKCLVELLTALESAITALEPHRDLQKEIEGSKSLTRPICIDDATWSPDDLRLLDEWLSKRNPEARSAMMEDIHTYLRSIGESEHLSQIRDRSALPHLECLPSLPGFGQMTLGRLLTHISDHLEWKKSHVRQKSDALHDVRRTYFEIRELLGVGVIDPDDVRLRYLLPNLYDFSGSDGTLAKITEEAISVVMTDGDAESTTLYRLKSQLIEYAQYTLEDELKSIVFFACVSKTILKQLWQGLAPEPSVLKQNLRNVDIVLKYFGWDGQGGATLQETAEFYGLTRERVRQICKQTTNRLESKKTFAPVLDRAITFINLRLPVPADDIARSLSTEGLTYQPFGIEGIFHAAEMLGRDLPFRLECKASGKPHSYEQRWIFSTGEDDVINLALSLAAKLVRHWGAATLADVIEQVRQASDTHWEDQTIRDCIVLKSDFKWLDEATGWFWLSANNKNPLIKRIRKVLSVTERIDVSELRSAISRDYRMEGFSPPRRVLIALCRQIPGIIVEGCIISSHHKLDWKQVLNTTEATIVGILKSHGQVIARADLETQCVNAGMNRSTFYMYLGNSTVVAQYARGVYGLPGESIEPGVIESISPNMSRRTRVLKDYGWTVKGNIWVGYILSEAMFQNGAFSIPSALKEHLQGEFRIQSGDGTLLGMITIKDNSAWGLRSFFSRRGGEAGDHIAMVFNARSREVTIRIGSAEILEAFYNDDNLFAIVD